MKTTFYYQRSGQTHGPVHFNDLIELVRSDRLEVDDQVKADWQSEWNSAGEVVGLFHIAGREDVLSRWKEKIQSKARQALKQTDAMNEVDLESLHIADSSCGNYRDTLDEHRSFSKVPGSHTCEIHEDSPSILSASQAVLDDSSPAINDPQPTENLLQQLFRFGVAIGTSNMTAYLIFRWSERELYRFPQGSRSVTASHLFPFYGFCSQFEFALLTIDAMLISGALGYGAAKVLERITEERM